jgi:hypothetical protein
MPVDEARLKRALRNEEFFRGANQAIARDADDVDRPIEFLCECAGLECATRLRIAPDEWREVHEQELRFVVAPGHVVLDVERVVCDAGDYQVVEKFPIAS